MNISIGISPCPNDTFIFDAIYNKRIDTHDYNFEFIIEDVEYLNKAALIGKLDVTKLSYFAFSKVMNQYQMLNSGGALGKNCGPLLIAKNNINIQNNMSVAIPGIHTTANFLLTLAYPNLTNKKEILFSEIEQRIIDNEFDLGLIIHESRFTYEKKGLCKILDLGEYWEELTHSPLPLGGIVIKRNIDEHHKKNIDSIISESVQYAFKNPEASRDWTKIHAQELEDDVIKAHIDLYVNNYSIELGTDGKKGVYTLFEKLKYLNFIDDIFEPLIVG